MKSEKRLIDANLIEKFIMDGLNNPDKLTALGHDAIEILAEIEFAPTVDAVEVVHGRWIDVALRYTEVKEECSVCHGVVRVHGFRFCPNCGAKMDGDGNGAAQV